MFHEAIVLTVLLLNMENEGNGKNSKLILWYLAVIGQWKEIF